MSSYIITRLIQAIVVMLIVATMVFFMINLIPGDPAIFILGGIDRSPDPEQVAQLRTQLGLDLPLHVRYVNYITDLLRLDFGESLLRPRPVLQDISTRVQRTLMLVVPATLLASILGILAGVYAAIRRNSYINTIISTFSVIGISIPAFVIGGVLILIFAINLKWIPTAGGFVSPRVNFVGFLQRAILPIITLAAFPTALITRMTRSTILENLRKDYVRTAYSRGLSEGTVILKHVLRNSLISIITVIGFQFGHMFGNSVIIESIFNWPGLSLRMLTSMNNRDYPVVQAIVIFVALVFVIVNLLTDLTYALLDPKIKYD